MILGRASRVIAYHRARRPSISLIGGRDAKTELSTNCGEGPRTMSRRLFVDCSQSKLMEGARLMIIDHVRARPWKRIASIRDN